MNISVVRIRDFTFHRDFKVEYAGKNTEIIGIMYIFTIMYSYFDVAAIKN